MSWICKQCETVNTDDVLECEVCDAVSPHLSLFEFDHINSDSPTGIRWKAECCDRVYLSYGGRETDVTYISETKILAKQGSEVTFIVENEVSKREFKYRLITTPEIQRFDYTPNAPLYVGDKIKLRWDVTSDAKCSINGCEIKGNSSERTISSVGANCFTLRAWNDFKESVKSLQVDAYATPLVEITSNIKKIRKGKGEVCVIKWQVKNATSAFLEHGNLSENVELIGEKSVRLEETTTFCINAVGLDGKRTWVKKQTVEVFEEAIVEFNCSTRKVIVNRPAILRWSVQNAKDVELIDFGKVASSSDKVVTPDKATDYVLRVSDEFGIKDYTCHIDTWNRPNIEFNAVNKKLNRDKRDKAQINWSITNVKSATLDINGISSHIEPIGRQFLELEEPSTLTIRAIGLDGESVYEKHLEIAVYSEAKIEFTVDKKYTLPDVPVELQWHVENAKDVELIGFGKEKSTGTKSVKVDSATIFCLKVTDEFDTKEEKIEVKILPLPQIMSINVPIPEFSYTMNVKVNIPRMDSSIPFPQIQIPGVDIRLPRMTKMDKFLPHFEHTERTNVLGELKSIFTYYYNKLKYGK